MNYESRDASLRVIGISTAILVFWIAGSLAVAAWFYAAHYSPPPTRAWLRQTSFTEGPTERTSIEQDWSSLQEETKRRLESYGWIDRKAGIAQIPIERAMDLMVERAKQNPPAAKPPVNSTEGRR
jgi:hypothetical protein